MGPGGGARSHPLPSWLQPCCCSPGAVGCLSCKGSLLPAQQSPNAISGKLIFVQPQPFLLHGAISSHGLVVAVVAFMRPVPVSPFSITLSCCSPAMTTLPHVCRGHQACGSFLSLSKVVKSCVSNDWY